MIREMLNSDEQPVHEVMAAKKRLDENGILEIIAPFIPALLLDKTLSLEYNHWIDKRSETEYRVYFKK
jgi:hypothetical protein